MTNEPWRPRETWRPTTFHFAAYKELEKIKAFKGQMHIFPVAVVIGFLLDRKRKTSRADAGEDVEQILTTDSLLQPDTDSFKFFKDIIFDYIATYMIKKENDREIERELEEMADGGIEYLMEIHDKYGGKVETVDILTDIKKKFGQESTGLA